MSLKLASCVVCCWMSVFLSFRVISFTVSQYFKAVRKSVYVGLWDCPILWSNWRISFHISHHQKFQITVSREACGYFLDNVGKEVFTAGQSLYDVSPAVAPSVRRRGEAREVSEWQILRHQTLSLRLSRSVTDFSLQLTPRYVNRPDCLSDWQPETNLSPRELRSSWNLNLHKPI